MRALSWLLLSLIFSILLSTPTLASPAATDPVAAAETVAPPEDPPPISPREAADQKESGDFAWVGEIRLTLIIFIFGLIALAFFYFLHRTQSATPYVLRIYVIIILVFGTLLIVSSAYGTEQVAPVVGFFGTIAGYLVGRNEKDEKN